MVSEIISTVERRRKWPPDEKLRILEQALAPGASTAAVADRNGVCRSLLYTWLRLVRAGRMRGVSISPQVEASFVPVRIAAPAIEPPAPSRSHQRGRRPAQVEVTLTNGRVIKVDECIDPAALAQLATALDGGGS
jgi:transposase